MCPKKAARRRSLHHANLYATSLDTGTPSALARLSITSEVGFAVPHSTALTVRTHTPEAKASRSCDHPNSNLFILTFTPIVVDNMTRPFLRAASFDSTMCPFKKEAAKSSNI